MKKTALLIFTFLSLAFSQCKKQETCTEVRTGAICNDNTTTTSTGSGTCSGHGGVKEWTTKKECK